MSVWGVAGLAPRCRGPAEQGEDRLVWGCQTALRTRALSPTTVTDGQGEATSLPRYFLSHCRPGRANERQQTHKSPKASNELEKKSRRFFEAQVSVPKTERTHPLLGRTASADSLPPAQSFPARPSQGLPRHQRPLPRDAGGVGAALSFPEHSPEVTLGEASYCPVAKQKNHSAEGGAPLPRRPARGLSSTWSRAPPRPRVPGFRCCFPEGRSLPCSPAGHRAPHRTRPRRPPDRGGGGGRGATRSPTPTVAAGPASEPRGRGEPGWGRGTATPPRLPPLPPAAAPLSRRPIGGLLD